MKRDMVFLIGAHKAGTTSVAEWLGAHPGVSVARSKEPSVFTTRTVDGPDDAYWREFDEADIWIDASTNYSICASYPGTAARIQRAAPTARIIYLTRDPLSRLWSAWRQHLDESAYAIADRFGEAVATDPSLVDATRYATQLEEYRRHFPPRQIFTCPLETLAGDPGRQEALLRFLTIAPTGLALPRRNGGEEKVQDRAASRLVLGSAAGQRVAGTLRATPARQHLATLRRRILVRPIEAPIEERSWSNVPAAEELRLEAQRYLRELGVNPGLWPSLQAPAAASSQ